MLYHRKLLLCSCLIVLTLTLSSCRPPRPQPTNFSTAPSEVEFLFTYHNQERTKRGLKLFTHSPGCTSMARSHALAMARYHIMSHESVGDGSFLTRVHQFLPQAQIAGENICEGQHTSKEAFAAWMSDGPHRANILGDFTSAGFGEAEDEQGNRWWAAGYSKP